MGLTSVNGLCVAHNGGVSAGADARACAVGHGAAAVFMQLVVELAEPVARAKGGLPGRRVHGEVFKVGHVDHEGAILAPQAVVAASRQRVSRTRP